MRFGLAICAVGLVLLACASSAAADIDVSTSSGTLTLQVEDGSAIVEEFVDSTRNGVRIRQIAFGDPTISSSDADCQTNSVFNDVICTPFPSHIVIEDDGTSFSQDNLIIGGSNVGCAPTTGTPVSIDLKGEDGVTAPADDSVKVRTACGGNNSAAGVNRLHPIFDVFAGGGEDSISGGRLADTLSGGPQDDTISGGAGNDSLRGNEGADTVSGGTGDDELSGAPDSAPDRLDGKSGTDTVNYGNTAEDLDVTLDGVGNDGAPRLDEHDNLVSIEKVVGGFGNDSIQGSSGSETLLGGAGDDEIDGGLGGTDTLGGGPARTTLSDDDLIDARDGVKDTVSCGAGQDQVIADLEDAVFAALGRTRSRDAGCESVMRFAIDDGPPAHVVSKRALIDHDGSVHLRIACPRNARVACEGRIRLVNARHPRHGLAAAAYAIALGHSDSVGLQLGEAAARSILRSGVVEAITRERGKSKKGPRSARSTLPVRRRASANRLPRLSRLLW